MREFIYYSRVAPTAGNMIKDDLQAGRVDIAIHVVIASFFLSHDFRKDTKLHLVFYGQPDPPKHIEMQITDELEISKKDVGNLIKKLLYKYKPNQKTEVLPGSFIEKRSFLKVVEELRNQGKEIFLLDKKGRDIRDAEIQDNCVFVLGDHEGMPKKELKRLKKIATPISIGPKTYFASQVVAIVNNELDRRNL